jgi:hypothetical protein
MYLLGAAGVALGLYGSYLIGQKNPERNVLDIPPREYGQKAAERYEENKRVIQDRIDPNKK